MVKSSSIQSIGEVTETETVLEYVTLALLFPALVVVSGPSGMEYTFNGAGSKVKVLKSDADYLLSKTRPKACCGGSGLMPYFELAS